MVKEFQYRGETIQKLKELNLYEFAKFLPSRQRRSLLRQIKIIEKFLKNCEKKIEKNKKIRTHSRQLVIVPKMIDLTVFIYNGKEFFPVKITGEMLGHRLGEFVLTRKRVEHGSPGIGATRSSAFLSVK